MLTRARTALAAVTLTTALAGSGFIVATGTAQAASGSCYITAKAATIRSKASAHSTAVGIAYKGQGCKERSYRSGWDKVTVKKTGKTGWIRSDLVHTADDDAHTCIPEDEACHEG